MIKNIKKMSKWFMNLSLTTKIIISYSIIFVTFFTAITVSYQRINNDYTVGKVKQMSLEIADSIGKNFDTVFDSVNSQSKILISNKIIQDILISGDVVLDDYIRVSNYLTEFVNFDSKLSSIYVFDLYGNKYYIENESPKNISLDSLKKESWFSRLEELKGGYLLSVNEQSTFGSEGGKYISFMRVINNLDSQKPIGYLVMNISSDQINKTLSYNNDRYNTMFFLKDESSNIFISPDNKLFDNISNEASSEIIRVDKMDYILSNTYNNYGWEITSITPINELKKQSTTYGIALFIAIIVSGILFIFGMVIVSLMVTKPIQKLALTMSSVENGEFKEADFETWNDEIGKLKEGYNLVIREIKRLFKNIVKENKAKRKKELEILQSQIKPHFLYNSFDAISSLALSVNNWEVYELVKALSKFYKGFLNYGSEKVTVKHELEIVEQYLAIQKIRFGEKFTFIKNYDSNVFNYMVPRLILQPLVENAFNHGIKPLPSNGVITLDALCTEDSVELRISDNGVGMSAETIKAIKDGQIRGVGLRATIERLRIYYNAPDVFQIDSGKGRGTVITIKIPVRQEEIETNDK
jgi:two-component system sensor histidine kinase YesM